MERTLVILKPSCLVRGLVGDITARFERKGLKLIGMKMCRLTDEQLKAHYAQHVDKPFYGRIKDSMQAAPVIVCCYEGVEAISVVRRMAGATSGRQADFGTIRGDYGMSFQENLVHTSDSPESAKAELARFFKDEEIYPYVRPHEGFFYSVDEK